MKINKTKPSVPKGRRTSHVLTGGPFHGQVVQLYTPGTLAFSVPSWNNGERGYYDQLNHWRPV